MRRRFRVGKRKVFLAGSNGLFFLMALLRANDAALHGEIQAGLDAVPDELTQYAGGFRALQALLWLVQGLDTKAREMLVHLRAAMPKEPLSAACVALAEFAVDAGLARKHRNDLASRFEQLKVCLPLIARIHAEILAEVADAPDRYAAFLADTGHVDVVFTRLIKTRQPWERALESLGDFLSAGTLKPAAARPARKTRRLAWFVDPDTLSVDVAEQSAKGREGWTDGRAVAMKRLHEQDPASTT